MKFPARFMFHILLLSFLSLATLSLFLLYFSCSFMISFNLSAFTCSIIKGVHFSHNESLGLISKPILMLDTAASLLRHQMIRSPSSDPCAGRKIYMYDLPPAFNAQILQQCHYKIAHWINFCPHILNHGFGKSANYTANHSLAWADWYETDPYMLEVIFHSRMAFYPCRTTFARDADAFFIPYYTGLDALHYLYGDKREESSEHGKDLVRWLIEYEGGEYWRRRGGHDHFIMMGRTAWDFTKYAQSVNTSTSAAEKKEGNASTATWGTSFAVLPELENVTALFIERRPWVSLEQAIPYPIGFHPSSLRTLRTWQRKVRASKRNFLMAFVGAPRPPDSATSEGRLFRQSVIDECLKNQAICTLIDCRKMHCETESVRIAKRMLHAHFCLQPPGDTPTRRSTFDGLLSGCIPVFFSNDSAYTQYTWHFPPHEEVHPSSYSVIVPSHEIHELVPLLSSFSTEDIGHMRSFIVKHLIPRIIYIHPHLAISKPSLRDAFQVTLDNILRRVATN